MFFYLALLLLLSFQLKSQEEPVKFVHGWGTELNFNPFNGSLSLNNATGQIKIRKFISDEIALRLSFTMEHKSEFDSEKNAYGSSPYEISSDKKSTLFAINLGVEKHFNKGQRLSPYIGFDLGSGLKISENVNKFNDITSTLQGAWAATLITYSNGNYFYSTSIVERGYWSANASIFTGFDFYMADNFYFGYELAFGLDYFKYSKIEQTRNPMQSIPDYFYIENIDEMDAKSWRIGPRLLNGIRIGYNF